MKVELQFPFEFSDGGGKEEWVKTGLFEGTPYKPGLRIFSVSVALTVLFLARSSSGTPALSFQYSYLYRWHDLIFSFGCFKMSFYS